MAHLQAVLTEQLGGASSEPHLREACTPAIGSAATIHGRAQFRSAPLEDTLHQVQLSAGTGDDERDPSQCNVFNDTTLQVRIAELSRRAQLAKLEELRRQSAEAPRREDQGTAPSSIQETNSQIRKRKKGVESRKRNKRSSNVSSLRRAEGNSEDGICRPTLRAGSNREACWRRLPSTMADRRGTPTMAAQ
ncbi:hypothetical protein Q5752_007124 [Cryptotrichosporon argae]